MGKKIFLAAIFFMTLHCYGSGQEFFTVNIRNDGTVLVEINDHVEDYSYAELLRSEKESDFVPVFEFTTGISSFTERFSPYTCYRARVYFLSGSSVITDIQCVKTTDFFAFIDAGFLFMFFLFVISCLLPFFYYPESLAFSDNDATRIFTTIKGLLGEESRDVSFLQSDYSFGNPMKESFKSLIALFSFYCDAENDVGYNLPFFEKHSGFTGEPEMTGLTENSITVSILPASMISGFESGEKIPALMLSCSTGSIESDYTGYKTSGREKVINLSVTVPGVTANLLSGGKSMLSLETFTLASDIESIRQGGKPGYGPYFFIVAVTVMIFAGSVLYTVNSFFPILTILRNFMEGGN